MTNGRFRRLQVLSVAGLVCIILLVTLASAADQASGTLAGKNTPPGQDPVQHPDKSTPVPRTTQAAAPVVTTPAPGTTQVLQTPVPSATNVAPAATQTTDTSSSALSNPSIIAASIGLVSAGIGAGVTLYTHAKKK